MHTVGILLKEIQTEQKLYSACLEANKLVKDDTNVILFYEKPGQLIYNTSFALMEMTYVYGYKADLLIATDLYTSKVLKNCYAAKQKIFYVWNLEWMYQQYNFRELHECYFNNTLAARSQDHYDIINKVWKQPNHIIEDFRHEDIKNILRV